MPRDVLRFEILLYVSLLLDCVSAALFGIGADEASEASRAFVNVLSAIIIVALFVMVWLAARQRKNWARWTLFGFFVLTLVLYVASFGDVSFGVSSIIDVISLVASAFGFFFAFTASARQWFKT
jgi:hypothetical protein